MKNEKKELTEAQVATRFTIGIVVAIIFVISLFRSIYFQDVGEVVVPEGSTPMVEVRE